MFWRRREIHIHHHVDVAVLIKSDVSAEQIREIERLSHDIRSKASELKAAVQAPSSNKES